MDIFEQKTVLDSLTVLVDSREQDTERARERYKAFKCPYRRATLDYGDYTYQAVLPQGNAIYDEQKTISAQCVVERKMSLDELAACFTTSRDRFRREFDRAAEHGAKIYLVVENGSWEKLLDGRYRSRFNPNAYLASLTAWLARYDMTVIFCKEQTSGKLIKEILYRDLKERLDRGEYDKAGTATGRLDKATSQNT